MSDDEMPMFACGWCGKESRMRVDTNKHPLDVCPHCETEGFMSMSDEIKPTCDPEAAAEALRQAGVFKGEEGLHGLAESSVFWQYGTRLYYGLNINDYLHRDVIRAAVKALAELTRLRAEMQALRELPSKWQAEAERMDDIASDEPDDETIMALECRERSRTLRDCANAIRAAMNGDKQ